MNLTDAPGAHLSFDDPARAAGLGGDGQLVISGGGRTTVATDRLLTDTRSLHALAAAADGWATRLHRAVADDEAAGGGMLWHADDPEPSALGAYARLRQVQHLSSDLAGRLHTAAENYGAAERWNRAAAEDVGAWLAWGLGRLLGFELMLSPGLLIGGLAAFFIGRTELADKLTSEAAGSPGKGAPTAGAPGKGARGSASPGSEALEALKRSGVICSPAFVAMLRVAVSSVDDGMLGMLGAPLAVTRFLDDDETGLFGLRDAARTVIALAGPRLLKETPVDVREDGAHRGAAPRGFADLAARIPTTGAGKPQVRIEKYENGGPRPGWIVLVGGTADENIAAGDEPWDDVSNVQAVGRLDPGSVRATLEAMDEAGVGKDDDIVFAGYSQGGIVTQEAITRGGYSHASQFTMGSPVGQLPLPDGVQDVSVEIAEDPIPALGGEPRDAAHGGLQRTVVTRSIYTHSPAPTDTLIPAHGIAGYRETAAMMDASSDPRLVALREKIAEVTGAGQAGSGATGPAEVTLWRADRVHPPAQAAAMPTPSPGPTPTAPPASPPAAPAVSPPAAPAVSPPVASVPEAVSAGSAGGRTSR